MLLIYVVCVINISRLYHKLHKPQAVGIDIRSALHCIAHAFPSELSGFAFWFWWECASSYWRSYEWQALDWVQCFTVQSFHTYSGEWAGVEQSWKECSSGMISLLLLQICSMPSLHNPFLFLKKKSRIDWYPLALFSFFKLLAFLTACSSSQIW